MPKSDLLLLHGAMGSADIFSSLMKELSNQYNVHAIDFNGHGQRDIIGEKYTVQNFIEDILGYLDQNSLSKINIFGYSMGGLVAMLLAARYPEKVEKVFTYGAKIFWTPEVADKTVKFLDSEIIMARNPDFAKQLEAMHRGFGWQNVVDKTVVFTEELGRGEAFDKSALTDLNVPLRYTVGDRDHLISLDEVVKFSELVDTDIEIGVFPNSKHALETVNAQELKTSICNYFI